jgi:hypothetical protein
MSYPQQVTMIDDLPDLEEITTEGYDPEQQPGPNITGFIKRNYMPPSEAGMSHSKQAGYNNYRSTYGNQRPQSRPINMGPEKMIPGRMPRNEEIMDDINPYPFSPESRNFRENFSGMGNCLDVSGHIENCPICSKLYKHDKTIMIITIVVLAIISILLLKKVLNL